MDITFTRENSRGVETEHKIQAVYQVCEACEGHGTHPHRAIGEHAYSAEEFAESFDDEEREEYFRRGGRYDVQCGTCHGARVEAVVDVDTLEKTTRGRRLLALYFDKMERQARWAAEERAERRMGC